MAGPRPILLLLLTALPLLAGCATKEPPSPDSSPADPDAQAPATRRDDAPEASPHAPAAPGPPAAAPAAIATEPVVQACEVGALLNVEAQEIPLAGAEVDWWCVVDLASRSGAPFRSAVVEVAWSVQAPTVQEAVFGVHPFDGERPGDGLGHARGTEPTMRIVLAGGALPAEPRLVLAGTHGGTGAFVDLKATFTFSLFETPEPPAGYTALG